MVRKIQKNIDGLRKENINLISVSNSEWYSLLKDEIRNSIAIEGVFSNRNDLITVLEKNKKTTKQKTAAILGYFEAASMMYEYANNQYKEGEFLLRLSDIKQIHTILMRYEKDIGTFLGDIGSFRKANIKVSQATFNPIDVFYIKDAMNLFVKWVNTGLKKNKDAVKLASLAHVWFESIHPFRDGNGRVGRILLSYLLIGSGYINIAIKGISKKERMSYYNALEACDDVFEKISREIEQGSKVTVQNVDKMIKNERFDEFENMVIDRLEDSLHRLKRNDKKMNSKSLVPLNKLSTMFDYSSDYLRNLINRGQLKAEKRDGKWFVRLKDMEEYVKER